MDPRYIGTNLLNLFEAKDRRRRWSEADEDAYYRSHYPAAAEFIWRSSRLAVMVGRRWVKDRLRRGRRRRVASRRSRGCVRGLCVKHRKTDCERPPVEDCALLGTIS